MSFLTAFTPIDPNSWVALYYLRWLPFLAATVRVDLLLATPDCVFPPTPTTPYTAPSPVDTTCLAVALVFMCFLIMVVSGLVLCGVRFKLPQLVQRLGGYTLIVCLAEALIFVLLLNTIQNIYKYTAHSLYRLSVAFLDKDSEYTVGLDLELIGDMDPPTAVPLVAALAQSTAESIAPVIKCTPPNFTPAAPVPELATYVVEPTSPLVEPTIPLVDSTAEPIFVREEPSNLIFEIDPLDPTPYLPIFNDIVQQIQCESAAFHNVSTTLDINEQPVILLDFFLIDGCLMSQVTAAIVPEGHGCGTIRLQHGGMVAVDIVNIEMIGIDPPLPTSVHVPQVPGGGSGLVECTEEDLVLDYNDFLNFGNDDDDDDDDDLDSEVEVEVTPIASPEPSHSEPSVVEDHINPIFSVTTPPIDNDNNKETLDFGDLGGFSLSGADYGLSDDMLAQLNGGGCAYADGSHTSEIDDWMSYMAYSSPSTSSDDSSSTSSETSLDDWTSSVPN